MFERFIGEVINKNGLRLRNDRENMPTDWRRAAFLPEKAEECLLPNLSIGENLLLPSYPHIGIPVIHRDIEKFVTNSFLEKLGYLGSSVQIENLDRRECKLLCIERWKLAKAAALVMENPEFGIDLQAQDQIFAALKSVSFSGIPVIITSYKIDALCNRCFAVLVTEHGYCKEILRGNNSARPEMWL